MDQIQKSLSVSTSACIMQEVTVGASNGLVWT